MLVFLEYFSILLAGGAGILALMTEYKDKGGNITDWGKVALAGVLVTAIVSTSVKYFKDQDSAQKTLTEIERANTSLLMINKSLHPLKDFKVEAEISYSLNHPLLKPYANKFRKTAIRLRNKVGMHDELNKYKVDIFSRSENVPNNWMRIYPNSPVIAPFMAGVETRNMLSSVQLHIRISDKQDEKSVAQFKQNNTRLNFTYFGTVFEPTKKYSLDAVTITTGSLLYNFKEDRFYISAPEIKQEVTYINNRTTSFLDLLGTNISVRSSGIGFFNQHARIETLKLISAIDQTFILDRNNFKVRQEGDAYLFFHTVTVDVIEFYDEYSE